MLKSKLLLGIIILASIVRLFSMSTHPGGFTPDEASFGYDAYSILHTGQDQWGSWFPLTLKSFGDYKMPVYTYLAMPSISLFGLNIFATRLPNAIFGILAVWATYLFVMELFKKKEIALVSSLMLAISPWHIAMSRGAFEANLTTFFLTISLYFLLLSFKNPKYYSFVFVFAGINLFTYHTARLLTLPVLLLAFLTFAKGYLKEIRNMRKGLFIASIFVLLTLVSLFSGGGQRLATSNIFSLSNNVFTDRLSFINAGMPEILAKITFNKLSYVINIFATKYLDYFSFQFLFTQGAREATYGMIPGMGVLYWFEIVSVLFAIFFAIKDFDRKIFFIIFWILLSPFPAALSLGPGLAANRAAFMMPAIQIFSAYGLYKFYEVCIKYFNKKILTFSLSILILFSVARFVVVQWYVQPVVSQKEMIYGTEELFSYLNQISSSYQTIILDKNISEAHIFIAFYNKIDPSLFQQTTRTWNFENNGFLWVDQQPEYRVENYLIRNIDWQRDLRIPNSLVVYRGEDIPQNVHIIKVFRYPDQSVSYYLIDTTPNVFAKL